MFLKIEALHGLKCITDIFQRRKYYLHETRVLPDTVIKLTLKNDLKKLDNGNKFSTNLNLFQKFNPFYICKNLIIIDFLSHLGENFN